MAETKYTEEHEWIRVEGDVGTIGITQYAQEQLGDVVFVDVPAAGRKGAMTPTEPAVHTLIVEPDADRVTVLWRGCAAALRRYAPQELATMPLRVEWAD